MPVEPSDPRRGPENAAVAVTSGLLKRLNRDELQGVIAHEIAHIRNRDIQLMLFAGVLAGAIVILAEVGLEGVNFDTCGSAGDADFLAALEAVAGIKKILPDLPILMGASGEFILGMHGEITYNGQRLAGLYPHQQVKIVESAGAAFALPASTIRIEGDDRPTQA